MADEEGLGKHDRILAGLVFSLQAAAMQHLGKITNPLTGKVERDLEQARGTIDILEMLKAKCRRDTPPDILRLLDGAVMDLQMNYLDEVRRGASATGGPEAAPAEGEGTADGRATDGGEPGGAGSAGEGPDGGEVSGDGDGNGQERAR